MKHKVCFSLVISISVLWCWAFRVEAQPTFQWPVESAYDHLTATFGEPRPNGTPLGHWHKGVDVPKAAGLNASRPAERTVTYVGGESVVIH